MRVTLTTLLLTILRDVGHIVKVYMQEMRTRYVQVFLMIAINTKSEKYTLFIRAYIRRRINSYLGFNLNRNHNHICWHNTVLTSNLC